MIDGSKRGNLGRKGNEGNKQFWDSEWGSRDQGHLAKWSQGPGTFDHMVPGTRDHWLNFDWDQGPKLKGLQGPGTTLKIRIYFICRYSVGYSKNPKDYTYKGNQENDLYSLSYPIR